MLKQEKSLTKRLRPTLAGEFRKPVVGTFVKSFFKAHVMIILLNDPTGKKSEVTTTKHG